MPPELAQASCLDVRGRVGELPVGRREPRADERRRLVGGRFTSRRPTRVDTTIVHIGCFKNVAAATYTGDRARLVVIPGVGHFEVASPRASTWPTVLGEIRTLLGEPAPIR